VFVKIVFNLRHTVRAPLGAIFAPTACRFGSAPNGISAFKKRRCVIPASGWYEWRKNPDGTKTPLYFHLKDEGILAFAGLWEHWQGSASGAINVTRSHQPGDCV
jgi:hypothetical protein